MRYNMRILKGNIYFEGIDGAGKSTLAESVFNKFNDQKYILSLFEGYIESKQNIIFPIISPQVRKYGLQVERHSGTPTAIHSLEAAGEVDDYMQNGYENFVVSLRDFSNPAQFDEDEDERKQTIINMMNGFKFTKNPMFNLGIIVNFFQEAMLEDVDAAGFYLYHIGDKLNNLTTTHPDYDGSQEIVFILLEIIDRSPVSTFIYNVKSAQDAVMFEKFDRSGIATPILSNVLSLYYLYNTPETVKESQSKVDNLLKIIFDLRDNELTDANRDEYINMYINDQGKLEEKLNDDFKNKFILAMKDYALTMKETIQNSLREFSIFCYISVDPDEKEYQWDIIKERLSLRDNTKFDLLAEEFETNLEVLRNFATRYNYILGSKNNGDGDVEELRELILKEKNVVILEENVEFENILVSFVDEISNQIKKNFTTLTKKQENDIKIFTSRPFNLN